MTKDSAIVGRVDGCNNGDFDHGVPEVVLVVDEWLKGIRMPQNGSIEANDAVEGRDSIKKSRGDKGWASVGEGTGNCEVSARLCDAPSSRALACG